MALFQQGSFIFDANTSSPQELARKRAIVAQLMGQRSAPRNVGEGLVAIGDGIVANVLNRRANETEQAGQASASEAFNPLLDAFNNRLTGGFPAAPADTAAASSGDPMTAYQNAIASIESAGSGDYAAVGPSHPRLGRALGRYQVMEANIGPWSEAALGRRVSPDEFMANPSLQDAIFNHRFGQYVNKFGPEGAAQAWFGGEGGVGKLDRRDSLGTSIAGYTDKFRRALGGPASPAVAANEAMAAGQPVAQTAPSGPLPLLDDVFDERFGSAPVNPPAPMDVNGIPAGGNAFAQPAPPLSAPQTVQDRPVQVAQAGGGFPEMAGQNPQAIPAPSGPDLQMLLRAASNPWLNENQRAVVNTLLEQQLQAQDPYRQLQMQQGNLGLEIDRERLNQMRNPRVDPTDTQRNLAWRAQEAGLTPGTPEYADFMARGGQLPAQTNVTNVIGGEQLTPGQKKIDESFADTYLQWMGGGYADSAKQIEQLTESLDILDRAASEGQNISGVIGALPNSVQPFINPQGTIAREGVEEVVQRSLREILGAQFTEKEGERLIARAYNPALPPAENAKRVRRLLGQVKSMADARQSMVEYFDENGTLRGYKGKRPNFSQIETLENEWAREDDSPRTRRQEIDGYIIEEVD